MDENLTTAIIVVAAIIGIVVMNRKPKPKIVAGVGEVVTIGGINYAIVSMSQRGDGTKTVELQDLASFRKQHHLGPWLR